MKLQIKLKKNLLAIKESETQELRDELANAERILRTLTNEIAPLKDELKRLFEEARNSTNGYCFTDKEFEPFKVSFAKLPPTLDEIFDLIQTLNAQIFSTGNDPQESEKVSILFKTYLKNLVI